MRIPDPHSNHKYQLRARLPVPNLQFRPTWLANGEVNNFILSEVMSACKTNWSQERMRTASKQVHATVKGVIGEW